MKHYEGMNSKNTALLVVDIINSCVHEKCEVPKWDITFSKIRDMVPNLKKFIEDYRETVGGLVIFGRTVPWRREFLTKNLNELYKDPGACYYSEDTSGFAEEFYLVSPKEEDIVVTKNTYDAFADPKLIEVLEEKGIRYLVVTGVFGDGCVLASIVSGFSRGYIFVILKDLIETSDVPIRQELLLRLKEFTFPRMYGKVVASGEFLRDWSC